MCGLLFAATTINYMDRQVLAILAPTLQREIPWNEFQYGLIVAGFQVAYAFGQALLGGLIDILGTRIGYALSVAIWSLAAVAHGWMRTPLGFGAARAALGLGEAGNFPAAVKTVTEWFNERERAFATGLFNAGANMGAIAAPLAVPWLTVRYGWPAAFFALGALGFIWLAFWLRFYRRPQPDEISPAARPRYPWRSLLRYRETAGLIAARFLTDPVWWFYLYWTPTFLHDRYGVDLLHIGPPLVAVYLAADAGSVFGGWLPLWLMRRGWSVNAARKAGLGICACLVIPMLFATAAQHLWTAVALLGLATAGHQGWAANIFTVVSDLYPEDTVSSVVGLCGFGGSAGGALAATAIGAILQITGSYRAPFVAAPLAYFAALAIVQIASPRLKRVTEPADVAA